MDIEVAKNLAKLLGVQPEQIEKLGTPELPVEDVLNEFKAKAIESDALNHEKIKAELEESKRKGMMAMKGMFDEILGDDHTKDWWIKNKDKYPDQGELMKAYLSQSKILAEQKIETEKSKASKDAQEWMKTADLLQKKTEQLIAENERLQKEELPNVMAKAEAMMKEKDLLTKIWLDYTGASIDFKNETKRKQDFSTYTQILTSLYDFRDATDGSLMLFKKGTSEPAVDHAGKQISMRSAIEMIASQRGELIMSNPGDGGKGKHKEIISDEERRRQELAKKYGKTVGLK